MKHLPIAKIVQMRTRNHAQRATSNADHHCDKLCRGPLWFVFENGFHCAYTSKHERAHTHTAHIQSVLPCIGQPTAARRHRTEIHTNQTNTHTHTAHRQRTQITGQLAAELERQPHTYTHTANGKDGTAQVALCVCACVHASRPCMRLGSVCVCTFEIVRMFS